MSDNTNDVPWPESFEELVRANLSTLPPTEPLTECLNLTKFGLDSMTIISLLLAIEERYDITIPDDLLSATHFSTAKNLWKAIDDLITE